MLRTAARHDDRVRHEILPALDQIAANRRQCRDRAAGRRSIDGRCTARVEIGEELRKGLLTGTKKDGVCVGGRFSRQRRDVQPAERDE